VLGSWIT